MMYLAQASSIGEGSDQRVGVDLASSEGIREFLEEADGRGESGASPVDTDGLLARELGLSESRESHLEAMMTDRSFSKKSWDCISGKDGDSCKPKACDA